MKHPSKRLVVSSALALVCAAACALDAPAPPPKQSAAGGAGGSGGATGGAPPTTGGANTGGSAGSTGGTVAVAGSSGSSGSGGSSQAGGTGGTTGGTDPTGGSAGSGGSGGQDLTTVASVLDGFTLLLPCGQQTETRVCSTSMGGGCPNNSDPALDGSLTTDETVTLGGTPGTMYDVTLHIQGLVEAKTYQGGLDQDNSGDQEPADGFYVGGVPNNQANQYNVYMIRVTSPEQDYFLNSVGTEDDNRIRHSLFEMDYTATIRAEGGTTLRLVAADSNCSAIKNCAEPDVPSVCNEITFNGLDPMTEADIMDNPYNGQFIGMRVTGVVVAPP